MGLIVLLGRILLASLFIISGIEKFQNPVESTNLMTARYETVYNEFLNQTQFTGLPTQLKPQFMKQHGVQIALTLAGIEILGGILVVLGSSFGAYLLGTFILGTIAIIHNPWIFNQTHEQYLYETEQALKNIAIWGGLYFLGGKKTSDIKVAPIEKKITKNVKQQVPVKQSNDKSEKKKEKKN